MDLSSPVSAVIPSLDAEVLRVLAGTTSPLTGAQIHRLSRRGSNAGVLKVLARLCDQGIVAKTAVGHAGSYVGNRSHLGWPAIEILVDMHVAMIRRISEHLGSWSVRPISASLFGSAARRDGGVDSDIDIWLVAPALTDAQHAAWSDDKISLQSAVLSWTGNSALIIESTMSEVSEMLMQGAPFLQEVRRDAVVLGGLSPTELLKAATK